MSWFDGLLWPIMVAVAWIMVQFHKLFTALGLQEAGGAAWTLSIVGLVIVIRVALIPLFVRQIKASRGMQLIQPEMQAIQKKYKGKTDPASREAMSRETMELYRKHNTNPFSSCLPILAQSPIFFALFRVLNSLTLLSQGKYAGGKTHIGPLTQELARQAESATLFGAPLSGTFMRAAGNTHVQVVTIILIVAMSLTTFTTQRQLTMKNMPKAALEGPMAQQQKMLLYLMPLIFAFSGVNFPIGVLIYWTTTNLWSMGQQFYTIRRMPAPGSQAEAQLKERQARRAAHHGGGAADTAPLLEMDEKPRVSGQRQQPKRKDRAKSRPGTGEAQAASTTSASGAAPSTEDSAAEVARAPKVASKHAGDGAVQPQKRSSSARTAPGAGDTDAAPESGTAAKPVRKKKSDGGSTTSRPEM
ncbi:membrane protein insertase YidC [Cellulomonas sp. SG140]|uniref:membrane protein insertase YidC n=1 Tax=Cellulomonas sp. SG140 TaxID=2976536 RepID=UPI0021E8D9DD|nr:membrane protein insertase YidC [Cellulomonas sp. SG140]